MSLGKIFIVDDDKDFHSYIRDALLASDFDVTSAYSGEECIEKLSACNPDLVLLDMNMPGINGFQTCEKISKMVDVPIIFMSALVSSGTMDKIIQSDAVYYLSKPIRLHDLLDKIYAILNIEQ